MKPFISNILGPYHGGVLVFRDVPSPWKTPWPTFLRPQVWAVSLTEHQAMLDEILAAPQLLVLVSGNLAPSDATLGEREERDRVMGQSGSKWFWILKICRCIHICIYIYIYLSISIYICNMYIHLTLSFSLSLSLSFQHIWLICIVFSIFFEVKLSNITFWWLHTAWSSHRVMFIEEISTKEGPKVLHTLKNVAWSWGPLNTTQGIPY